MTTDIRPISATPAGPPPSMSSVFGIDFSDEQLDIITAPLEPAVVVAGAGSGKTTVMAARVTWLVANGLVDADRILGLTFTNKAAAELAGRVRSGLARLAPPTGALISTDHDNGEPSISTYHAFAHRVIAEHGLRLGLEPDARLVTEGTRYQLAFRVACGTKRTIAALKSSPVEVAKKIVALDAVLAERMLSPQDLINADQTRIDAMSVVDQQKTGRDMIETALIRIELAGLVEEFRAAKRNHDVIDFSDQLRLCADLALSCPEVAESLRGHFRVVLLDEYQDTSITQRVFMETLFGEGHPVTAVGDPCQGIYSWRGAEVANIDEFPSQFPVVRADGSHTPAAAYPLSVNRRSANWILDAANEVAMPLHAVHPDLVNLRPGRADLGPGRIDVALLKTESDEIDWVADQIAGLATEVSTWSDVAVLCREGAQIPLVHAALVARSVPAQMVGKATLLELPEVVEIVSMLEVIHDPGANSALLRQLVGPRWRIGPRDLAVLGRHAARLVQDDPGQRHKPGPADDAASVGDQLDNAVAGSDPVDVVSLADAMGSLTDEVDVSDLARQRLTAFAAELERLRQHTGEPVVDFVYRVIAASGLDVELSSSPEAIAASRRESIAAFVDLASQFRDFDREATLGAFLAWLRDLARSDDDPGLEVEPATTAVTVMTVHKAKGLEWPIVVVPFLTEGVFPSRNGADRWPKSPTTPPLAAVAAASGSAALLADPRLDFPSSDSPKAKELDAFEDQCRVLDESDERRLAYVAITRAQRRLIASGSWWGATQKKPRGPSPYLDILRASCEAGAGSVVEWAEKPDNASSNPLLDSSEVASWPTTPDQGAHRRRREVAEAVRVHVAVPMLPLTPSQSVGSGPELSAGDAGVISEWDRDIAFMLDSVRRDRVSEWVVRTPASLSVTGVMALAKDEQAYARSLRRPMPRRPVAAARRGSALHAWIETLFGDQPLLPPDDLPGAQDADIDSDADLEAMKETFLQTPYALRSPYALEVPVSAIFAGRVIQGRIDAVFRDGEQWELVDWKTNRAQDADPLQLAIYRIAWAELMGVPMDSVSASFVYVRTGDVVTPDDLPDRVQVERLLVGSESVADSSGAGRVSTTAQ